MSSCVSMGFITMDDKEETVLDFRAYCHSAGLSSQVMLKDKGDQQLRAELLALLRKLQSDPQYGIREIYTRKRGGRKIPTLWRL